MTGPQKVYCAIANSARTPTGRKITPAGLVCQIILCPKGFHRIRHYGLFAKGSCADNIARAPELLATSNSQSEPTSAAADYSKPSCPCCGGRMIVIEVFARGTTPRHQPTAPNLIRIDSSRPHHGPANLLITLAGSQLATAEHAQISGRRRKSFDDSLTSTPHVAHSSAALPPHKSSDPLDPNQRVHPRPSNPHSACGTALRSLSAVSFLGGFRTPAAEYAAPSLKAAGIRNPTQKRKSQFIRSPGRRWRVVLLHGRA